MNETIENEEELAELELGDRIQTEAEEEGDLRKEEESEGMEREAEIMETPEPVAPPTVRPVQIPVPVKPVLGKTGDMFWGKGKPKPHPHSELDDLFAVPKPEDNDIYVDDLFEVEDQDVDLEDDLSNLTQVSNEDIMGRPPKSKAARYKRTGRSYTPPTSMGGTR